MIVPVLIDKLSARNEKGTKVAKAKKAETLICVMCGKDGTGRNFCGYCGGELATSDFSEIDPLPEKTVKSYLLEIGSLFSKPSSAIYSWSLFTAVVLVIVLLNFSPLKLSALFLALFLIVFGCVSLATRNESKEMVFSTILTMIAFALVIGCEVFM